MTKSRPVSRRFWKFLKYLPRPLRAAFIRSKFDVLKELPAGVLLKQAETQDEISQALNIVYEAYLDLGYIDPHPDRMRFNKFLALPTSVFLVAKIGDEVVGTLTIIPDSALGLPLDQSWDLNHLRAKGHLLGEISSLCIKKSHKFRRGALLLPLCKLMFIFCRDILKVDTIVISTTKEVENFYTDILLFETDRKKHGDPNFVVKGNPSSFCYLTFNQELYDRYKKVYGHKPFNKNLYHFFCELNDVAYILTPDPKLSVHGYLSRKNHALALLLREHSALKKDIGSFDSMVIRNLTASSPVIEPSSGEITRRRLLQRIVVRQQAWLFIPDEGSPVQATILDISYEGFQIRTFRPVLIEKRFLDKERPVVLVLSLPSGPSAIKATIKWSGEKNQLGCKLVDQWNADWDEYLSCVWREIEDNSEKADAAPEKKTA